MISGYFTTIKGNRINVSFDVSTSYTIGTDEHIQFSGDPLHISIEYDEDAHLFVKKCEINLVTDELIQDFFTSDPRGIEVNIQTGGGIELFRGYVTPQSYSQDYDKVINNLTVNCVDYLGTLEDYHYRQSIGWEEAKKQSECRKYIDIMSDLLAGCTVAYTNNYQYIRSAQYQDLVPNLYLYDKNFVGDKEDKWMNTKDCVQKLNTYLNTYMFQIGSTIYVAPRELFTTNGSYEFYTHNGQDTLYGTLTNTNNSVTKSSYTSDDMQISYLKVIKKYWTTCSLDLIDEDLIDMFDSSKLKSIYTNASTIVYTCDKVWNDDQEVWELKNTKQFAIQPKESDDWKAVYSDVQLNNQAEETKDLYEKDADGYGKNAYKAILTFSKYRAGAMMAGVGNISMDKYEKYTDMQGKDYSVRQASLGDMVILPYNGSMTSKLNGNTQEVRYDNSIIRTEAAGGILSYQGSLDVAELRPENDRYPNFIIINGEIQLELPKKEIYAMCGGQKYYDVVADENQNVIWCNDFEHHSYNDVVSLYENHTHVDSWGIDYQDNDTNVCREYYDEYPQFHDYYKTLDNGDSNFTPLQDADGHYSTFLPSLPYGRSNDAFKWRIDQYITRVPMLVCELKVGDKFLVEVPKPAPNLYHESEYKWLTQTEAYTQYNIPTGKLTFCLTISPKNDERVFGTSYNLTNNDVGLNFIGKEGIAIPIKKTDSLMGKLKFRVIKMFYYNGDYRIHQPDVFDTYYAGWEYDHIDSSMTEWIGSMFIKDLTIGVASAYSTNNKDGDDDAIKHTNENENSAQKEETTYDFATRLSFEEMAQRGLSQLPAFNYAYVMGSNNRLQYLRKVKNQTTNDVEILEKQYIGYALAETKEPKLEVDVSLARTDWNRDYRYYPKTFSFNYLDGKYFVHEYDGDIKNESIKYTLHQEPDFD